MKFVETRLKGAWVIELDRLEDERGFFARAFCEKEFHECGLDFHIVQANMSYSEKRGALRGMHYQEAPYEEDKLVRCVRGSVFDAIIDLRPDSQTYCHWFGVELTDKNYWMIYVPKGFAHGFQTLEDNTVVFYQMSEYYHPEAARGVRWDDPAFGIQWPKVRQRILSQKDRDCAPFVRVGQRAEIWVRFQSRPKSQSLPISRTPFAAAKSLSRKAW